MNPSVIGHAYGDVTFAFDMDPVAGHLAAPIWTLNEPAGSKLNDLLPLPDDLDASMNRATPVPVVAMPSENTVPIEAWLGGLQGSHQEEDLRAAGA
jgi:hypothetical protein